ncbi:MAG: hypothetical protein KF878_15015 [Planctomycetes bacterium]|nr:hypothetical protein [Planctomycetota bacterium]
MRPDRAVDSIQWIDLPRAPARDLATLERLYFAWVPRIGGHLAAPDGAEGSARPLTIEVQAPGRPPAIRMTPPEEAPGRRARRILGGLLAYAGGELAFEVGPAPERADHVRLTVALRAFRPRMPLPVYLMTQRRLHERSTFAFLREVARTVPPV